MKYLLLFVLFIPQVQAGPYIEIGVGQHAIGPGQGDWWEGSDELGGWLAVGMAWEFNNGYTLDAGLYHQSHPFIGAPFNDEPETTLDSFIIKVRKEWD